MQHKAGWALKGHLVKKVQFGWTLVSPGQVLLYREGKAAILFPEQRNILKSFNYFGE
jgi:hypothetical protein